MQRQLLIIKLDGDYYGIDVRIIQEVIKNYTIREIPDAPNFVEGIISLRDSIVPLIRLKRLLNIPVFDLYRNKKVIIMNFGEGVKIGVLVDDIAGIHYYDDKEIQPIETFSNSEVFNHILGILKKDQHNIALLDVFSMLFNSKGEFLYKKYFKKGSLADHKITRQEYFALKDKVENHHFPFNEWTCEGIISYISKIATFSGKQSDEVLKEDSTFKNLHFDLTESRQAFFENKSDFYMIGDIVEEIARKNKKIKIWLLGNGSGEDAYSLSMLLDSLGDNNKYIIINSDYQFDKLVNANKGIFKRDVMENIPMELWPNLVEKKSNDEIRIQDRIRKNIQFDFYKSNLKYYPDEVDLIYAPNYFSKNYKEFDKILYNFYKALKVGGILALGLFENIEGFANNLKKYYIKNRIVFIKEK